MKVKATASGFYDSVRKYEGDEFLLSSKDHFSSKWMEEIKEPKKTGPKPKKPEEVNTVSED